MTNEARSLAILTEESEHQLAALRRGLQRAASFSLYIVVAEDLERVAVLRRLKAWSGASGVPALHFFPEGEPGARAVDAFLAAKDVDRAPAGAVIPDVDALIEVENGNVLEALNVARDVLGEIIAGPLVLVISPECEGELARRAPDLFDVRAGTVVAEAVSDEPLALASAPIARTRPETVRASGDLEAEAKSLRALAAVEDPPLGALTDAWLRLGRKLLDQREREKTLVALKEARALAERGGYTRGAADALVLEAQLLDASGKPDEATSAYEKAIALHKKLRNRQICIWIYNQLADLAYRRGQHDEAHLWRQKANDEGCDGLIQLVATNVRRLRHDAGMTVTIASEHANLHPRHWRMIEAGKANISLETLAKLSTSLDVDVSLLLRRPRGH